MKTQKIQEQRLHALGVRFWIEEEGKEVACAYLNVEWRVADVYKEAPHASLKGVYVGEDSIEKGYRTDLIRRAIAVAK